MSQTPLILTHPANQLQPEPDVDVCIVGAGPAGAVAAKRLVEAGYRVVCLEQGEWPDYSTARSDRPDYEVSSGSAWSTIPAVRGGPLDMVIDETDSDITALIWNGVGGSSVLYAGHWLRNAPSDFRVRTLDGIADDWPIDYETLAPYYCRIERDFAVSGHPGNPAFPGPWNFPMPALPIGDVGRRIAKAHNELGWHWWPGTNAIASRNYGRLKPCQQRGTCMGGCVDGAKSSVDITHWPDIIAGGGRIICRAKAVQIETNEQGLASAVVYTDPEGGVEYRQSAPVIILACNGVGTPHLLLSSTSAAAPDGLANSSGLVGKRLMMHPFAAVTGIFDDPLDTSILAPWGQQLECMEFYETDTSRGFVRGAKWNLMPVGGGINTTRPFPWGTADFWGPEFHQVVAERLGHSAVWGIIAEDLPDEANAVVLSKDVNDQTGRPAAKLVYTTSENSRRLLDFHIQRAQESLQAAGAAKTVVAPQVRETGWHLLGTTVMGEDPTRSVVDGKGRCHDVPNLFVFDGSSWPTSAGLNPTATIVAMALRNTELLIASRHNGKGPA